MHDTGPLEVGIPWPEHDGHTKGPGVVQRAAQEGRIHHGLSTITEGHSPGFHHEPEFAHVSTVEAMRERPSEFYARSRHRHAASEGLRHSNRRVYDRIRSRRSNDGGESAGGSGL